MSSTARARTLLVTALTTVALLAGGAPRPVAAAAPNAPPTPPAKPAAVYGQLAAIPAGDEAVTATADAGGYHLFAAGAGDGWRWRPLATLQPGGYAEEAWTGEHCLTGDGRWVVAVVAPWRADNDAAGLARGGLAYAVDAHSGRVVPVAAGVSTAYFDPGCGAGGTAALTRYLGPDQARTEVLLADPASGVVTSQGVVPGELTSAVPVGAGVAGVLGDALLRIEGGKVTASTPAGGPAFRLAANAAGGVDYLTRSGAGRATASAWNPSGTVRLGEGDLGSLRVHPGAGGHNALATARTGSVTSLRGTPVPSSGLPKPAPPTTTIVPDDGPAPAPPTCAVPRNDPRWQVPQPSAQMIEWATNKAGRGTLVGAGGTALRLNGTFNLSDGGWSPSVDFPLPAPFGGGGQQVPREILDGVLAQESNWNQASPHAPPGLPGNPYVADYYGYRSAGSVDYTAADCGYGLGQITDGMRLASGQSRATPKQQRVAVDYAENAGAAAQVLAQKWNTLQTMGITIAGASPSLLETWYFALWAYNSGINPQQSTGNTSGCTPGPGCADSEGNWGLGWTNNPANPVYDPQRHPFLHVCEPNPDNTGEFCLLTYDDAAHPAGWPYQEKVFGWIESSQVDPFSGSAKFAPTYNYALQAGFMLDLPPPSLFCDASSHCNPSSAQPCAHSADSDPLQWHCWWHQPVASFCEVLCHSGVATVADSAAEPAVANPHPPVCSSSLPAGTVVVDDSQNAANLVGCQPPTNGGTFTWQPNFDASQTPTGLIDLHQLGAGYRGRMLFTHLEDPADAKWGGTAVWQPVLDYDVYEVRVFVPDIGAAGTLSYTVRDGRGRDLGQPQPVNQQSYSNQWVPIGRYYLGPDSEVRASSVVPSGDGATDVAFDAVAFVPVPSYAALGDSYSSGEGAGNYEGDPSQPEYACHRSTDSYPRKLAAATGRTADVTVLLACSGATIANLTTAGQYGQPGQIAALPRHANLVTLTIGGNDAGFAPVLSHCLDPTLGCQGDYTGNDAANLDVVIRSLEAQLVPVYRQIAARAPGAQVVVLTYPGIFTPISAAGAIACSNASPVKPLPARDVEWLISETNHLDTVVATAARKAGVRALEERYAFAGHELCASAPYANGLVGTIASPAAESYHPNGSGYTQIATELQRAVANAALLVPPYANLRDPRPGVPNGPTARQLLGLIANTTYDASGWSRTNFSWRNPNGTLKDWQVWPAVYRKCNTRVLALQRDNDGPGFVPQSCTDSDGASTDWTNAFWWTPYDNPAVQVTVDNSDNRFRPDLDHVVPLKEAWSTGAGTWTPELRADFANDLRGTELITASATTNRSKGDSSIEEWQPPNPAYLCTYAEMWVAVKYQWHLGIDHVTRKNNDPANPTEWEWLNNRLATC